ncbi:MAG: DNA/RNA non-specific endonuclease [Saprospiraceae bacterium]|nr:DNA/RNA non-specific endonuclease [Saprospiraceae bacterium]
MKYRRNHETAGKGLMTLYRMVIIVLVLIGSLALAYHFFSSKIQDSSTNAQSAENNTDIRTYLPTASGQIIHHTYYSLSYLEEYEQAEWTAYLMSKEILQMPNVPRSNFFSPDSKVKTGSAIHSDYTGSGFTRGHLVPAGDMSFDKIAMEESFLMSNMSPQVKAFNNGIWKELEENVRDWTFKKGSLYIISGPVLNTGIKQKIGKNKVSVPSAFFKVLLHYSEKEKEAIAFIIPNERSEKPLQHYMVNIDKVEEMTGIDFFNDMINDAEEEKLESTFDKTKWPVSEKRYQLRISKWNLE